jgi:F420-non-reducing hydrogenase small subunit
MKTFAVLQLAGCAGCEVSLLNADEWVGEYRLAYMPLVISAQDVPEVDLLLVSGGVRNEEDLYNLRRAAPRARKVVAIGTCAISGGVASLGDRDDVRKVFLAERDRHDVPRLLPKCHPIDAVVSVDRYLPGCPPTPELFMALLTEPPGFKMSAIVCVECGRKKLRDMRPERFVGFQRGKVEPGICLINQGFLCIGSSTRGGCRAPCPRAGNPCVGCRGPSDALIEKESDVWLSSIKRVISSLTDIPAGEVDRELRSPHLSLFLFQFSDYSGEGRPPRPKEKVM